MRVQKKALMEQKKSTDEARETIREAEGAQKKQWHKIDFSTEVKQQQLSQQAVMLMSGKSLQ